MLQLKCLIIDDEKKAREGLKSLLRKDPEMQLLGECKDGLEAIQKIESLQPELIFLDIQMPGVNGFDVLQSIDKTIMPVVIFTTAYDQYALQAFSVHALGYLLKPFTNKQFFQSLALAKNYLKGRQQGIQNKQIEDLLVDYIRRMQNTSTLIHHNKHTLEEKLVIKSSGKVYFLNHKDIYYIEALDSYVKVHLQQKFHVVKSSLQGMLSRLPGHSFIRIHRSFVVNIHQIRTMEPFFNGDFFLFLHDNRKIKGSRNYKQNLLDFIAS